MELLFLRKGAFKNLVKTCPCTDQKSFGLASIWPSYKHIFHDKFLSDGGKEANVK